MKTTILNVEGMTCSSCVRHVEGALRKIPGVERVVVTLADGTVRVEHDGPTLAAMAAALDAQGYRLTSTKTT